MTVAITGNLVNALDPAMAEVFLDGLVTGAYLDYARIVKVRPASTRTIEKIGMEGPGAYAAPAAEANDITTQAIAEKYKKTYTMSSVELGYEISRVVKRFLDPVLKADFVRQLGVAAARKLSGDGFAVIAGGFTDTGPDGAALFSTAHPSNTGNLSNTATTALDYGSLETAIVALRRQKTPTGTLASVQPRFLVVPPELEIMARMLTTSPYATKIGSTSVSGGFQSNVIGSYGIEVVVAPDLSDANDWFLLGSDEDHRIYQYISKGPMPREYEDQRSESWVVQDYMIYAQGHDSWRGTYGVSVT